MKLARLLCVLSFVAAAPTGALAQSYGICQRLESALASLDRGADSRAAQVNQIARMRGDLDRLAAQQRSMGCNAPRGFLIFQGPPRPPECDQIDDQVSRLRSSIAAAERGGGDVDGQRRQIIVALAQNNCGPQYRAAVPPPQPQQQKPRNFFEALFGGPVQNDQEEAPNIDAIPLDPMQSSSFRTVCVRTCDGYFFPISNYANSSRFASDEALCRRLCPAAEVQLFAMGGSGDIQGATNSSGKSYMSLPNALRYRKELVPSCSCRAPGQSWAQALAGIEDQTTLQKGDILVTEEQAKEMSQPRYTDAKGKSTAPASAAQQQGATSTAPLAPAAEQPGQRPVRIISTRRPSSTDQPQQQ